MHHASRISPEASQGYPGPTPTVAGPGGAAGTWGRCNGGVRLYMSWVEILLYNRGSASLNGNCNLLELRVCPIQLTNRGLLLAFRVQLPKNGNSGMEKPCMYDHGDLINRNGDGIFWTRVKRIASDKREAIIIRAVIKSKKWRCGQDLSHFVVEPPKKKIGIFYFMMCQ